MKNKNQKIKKELLRTAMLIMSIVVLFTSVSFADDTVAENPSVDGAPENEQLTPGQDETQPDPDAEEEPGKQIEDDTNNIDLSKPRAITAEEIMKYATYHGKNAKRIPILTYHRIVSNKAKKSKKYKKDKWTISQKNFNKQMKWLRKKHYRTISCDEFYLWYMGKIKLPKRSVLITIDDGNAEAIERMLPVLRMYNMKATAFVIGKPVHDGGTLQCISEERVKQIQKEYPNLEFQSHTYNMHDRKYQKASYSYVIQDSLTQRKIFGFDYMAYPYGRKSNTMFKAYKDSGIRMAFSFKDYGFATKKQNVYRIRRFAVLGKTSMRKFKRWCT